MRNALSLVSAAVLSLTLLAPTAQAGDPAPAAAEAAADTPAATVASPQAAPATARMTRRQAMARLSAMYGVWSGPASGTNPDRSRYSITQTERIGPFLDGELIVAEGRGYREDGSTGFNALGVISFDEATQSYEIRAYAMGNAGTFPMTLTDTGYVWTIPAGPGQVTYTATITGDHYREVGVFSMPGIPPQQMFEMNLTRRGDSDWPAAGAIQP